MFNNASGLTASDVLALGNNDGFGGGASWWFIIVLFCLFGGFGNNWGNNSGAADNYVLTSDFSQLSRQLADSTSMTERKLDSVNNGICSLGYDQLGQMNGINTNILTNSNALQTQIAQSCYNTNSAITNLSSAMQSGFCQTNFNNQNNTRDIVDSQNMGTQAILSKLSQMESNAQADKIATLQAENQRLAFAQSQAQQNNVLINALRPSPIPSYQVANPYCCCGGYYGTTIS